MMYSSSSPSTIGPGVIDHQHPVAVAVEGDAEIRAMLA